MKVTFNVLGWGWTMNLNGTYNSCWLETVGDTRVECARILLLRKQLKSEEWECFGKLRGGAFPRWDQLLTRGGHAPRPRQLQGDYDGVAVPLSRVELQISPLLSASVSHSTYASSYRNILLLFSRFFSIPYKNYTGKNYLTGCSHQLRIATVFEYIIKATHLFY